MKGNRIQEVTMEITVGAFIFMVLLALAIFTIVISQQNLFKKTWEYKVEFEDVSGLKSGDNIFSRGLLVGRVKDLQFRDDGPGVNVVMNLEKNVTLREGSSFEIIEASLLGGKRLVINEGPAGMPLLDKEQLGSLKGQPTGDVMREALEIVRYIKAQIEESHLIENLDIVSFELVETARAINQGTGTVSRLIHDPALFDEVTKVSGNIASLTDRVLDGEGLIGRLFSEDDSLYLDLSSTLSNLNHTVSSVRSVAQRVESGEGLLGKVLGDDLTLYTNLVSTTESFRNLAAGLEQGEGTVGMLLKKREMYDKLLAVANNIEDMSGDVKKFTAGMSTGEGTIPKLMNDSELYEDVRGLVAEMRSLLGEARSTVDDLRETSPISTFSSIFFGAF